MPRHIHFLGIGGSGMSAVAQIAASQGNTVSGCDLQTDTPYIDKVKKIGIKVYQGHNEKHLAGIDLLCVTPAVFYQNPDHPEIIEAKKRGILIKWQDFMGTYLHKNKYLICVAGTHGKSTTTALAGLLLEKAGLDPTVEVGATLKDWHNNVRLGKDKYFISEADEYHDNFKTYKPDVVILTLVEYDHPEYFGSFDNMLLSYQKFLSNLRPGGTIIYNADSPGCRQLIASLSTSHLALSTIPYSLNQFPNDLVLSQPGNHNKLNALAIIKLAKVLNIDSQISFSILKSFSGLERRLDFLGEKNGIKVYDDYANHPSSYAATLSALRELYPSAKITAIIEPHTFSRLRSMLSELPPSVKSANQIIVSKIFAGRESDPGDFTGQDIVNAINTQSLPADRRAHYIPEFPDIVNHVKSCTQSGVNYVILVMGSGNSHKLARQILENL